LLLFTVAASITSPELPVAPRCPLLSAAMQLASIAATLVFYAPPHGLGPILTDMVAVLGGSRRAVVARELTKLHEEFYRWAAV
jgi:16S rRNA C1402 (ribose-2'-O) methylase RsmI